MTNKANFAAAVHSLRASSRLDELQAAILRRVYLPELSRWTERRRQIASQYLTGICSPRVRPLGRPVRLLVQARNVKLVLVRQPARPLGFFLLTAYPTP